MNLQPWIDGDLVGQENEGYKEGQLHCRQGWCTDSSCDNSGMVTPYLRGYLRGWDEAKQAGIHGTEEIPRRKVHWSAECEEFFKAQEKGGFEPPFL